MSKKPMDRLTSEFGFITPIPNELIEAIHEIGRSAFSLWCYFMYSCYGNKRATGDFVYWPGYDLI